MKNVVVIGASRGIGLEIARQLSQQGDKVYALCRSAPTDLKDLSVTVVEGAEVNDLASLKRAAEKIKEPIDWLLVVAGILRRDELDGLDLETVEEQLQTNTMGPLKSILAFKDLLKEGGKVGLVTSRMASMADNSSGGYYGYRMSKAALNMMGVNLAIDLKPQDITVLLLHPGFVKTELTGNQGEIEPDQAARGLLRLMETKGLEDTGTFWHANGSALTW